MGTFTVGVACEAAPGERRVALAPADVGALAGIGLAVAVEAGAGRGAWFADDSYADAGAEITAADGLIERSDVVACVRPPGADLISRLQPGQVVVGLLGLAAEPDVLTALADRGVAALSFDGLPRTLSRAQSMDALTSQASVAGYKAVLVAASEFGRFLPMMVTAAGTVRPARVLVLGAGVAGLAAIGTARRLGAVVSAYDVRAAARDEVRSVGGQFIEVGADLGAATEGGYARALTPAEQRALPEALAAHVARSDVVITTAQVPGRVPPVLVTEEAVKAMRPGSVVVDLAVTSLGGNVVGALPGRTVVTGHGVTIIGADNLAAAVPAAASTAYSRNILAVLRHLVHDGRIDIDPTDEIVAGLLVARDGQIIMKGATA